MLSQKCLAICNAQRLHLLASKTQATRCDDITKTSQYPVTDKINPGSLLPSVNKVPLHKLFYLLICFSIHGVTLPAHCH